MNDQSNQQNISINIGGNANDAQIAVGQNIQQQQDATAPPHSPDLPQLSPKEQQRLQTLHNLLDTHFNEEELRTLCFELGLEYDNLTGNGKVNKARELVTYFHRNGRLPQLIQTIRQERPNL